MWALALLLLSACKCNSGEAEWNLANGEACLSCHVGIEDAHPGFEGECTVCHGGNGSSTVLADAHVPVPNDWAEIRGSLPQAPDGFIKDFPPDLLDRIDGDYLRFINPGDIRAAETSCGGCHADKVASVKNSIMTTNAGHYMPTRLYAGLQDREALYGSHPAIDPDWDGSIAGTVPSLETLPPPDEAQLRAALAELEEFDNIGPLEAAAYDHYLAKNCNTCHAAGYPKNNSKALYRSTGCSACHMVYNADGVYTGSDEAMPTSYPVYPARHELTTAIPAEQCATCHFQGGRIGLNFRGIREGGFSADQTPPNAELWEDNVYGHTSGYYILDEDTTQYGDQTPPDVHFQNGMVCADCHVGSDVHGDGRIYTTSKQQQELRCEDCHGGVRERVEPDAEGVYRTQGGRPLTQLSTGSNGQVILTGKMDGQERVVDQAYDVARELPQAHEGMGVDGDGWSHTDSLTCDTCHNSWQIQCLGCHVGMDMRLDQTDYQTGTKTPGLTTGSRSWFSLDTLILCENEEGRAQSCHSSQQVQLSVTDFDGKLVIGDEELGGVFRQNDDYHDITGWSPFDQHTTSSRPRSCSTCHRKDESPEELERVRGVYGYGTGEFMLTNPEGPDIDALQFLDADGNQLTDFAHEGTGPLSSQVRERAIGVVLE